MSKRGNFFGWRVDTSLTIRGEVSTRASGLHDGQLVAFMLLPGGFHDLMPIRALTVNLP